MNRRQKIIVTVTSIFIVLLALLGLTFAYFLTQIRGNEETKSISVTTADLRLEYADGNGIISLINIMPGDPIPTKTFTVTNKGNTTVENYNVYLENVLNQFELKDDLKYTLTCKQYNTKDTTVDFSALTPVGECTGASSTTFPSVMSVIATNTIDEGYTHYYELKVEYLYQNFDQSIDMGKIVSAKVNIYDESTQFLATEIMNDTRITKNNIAPSFTGVETEEKGLYFALDDYGTSYYFRGAQSNNYVNFAGYTWRIVRINGDGSIRLILNDGIKVKDAENNLIYDTTRYNASGDNAYVGYMYGLVDSSENVCVKVVDGVKSLDKTITNEANCTAASGEWMNGFDATQDNLNSSDAKKVIDTFYETNLKEKYDNYLTDTIFCGDKEIANKNMKSDNSALGYGNNTTYYAASERLTYDSTGEDLTVAYPTFKCTNNTNNDYSRYTVNTYTTSLTKVITNGDLTYPIGLISADEVVYAGGWNGAGSRSNPNFYLYINTYGLTQSYDIGWWTMTPKYFKLNKSEGRYQPAMFSSLENENSKLSLNTLYSYRQALYRPVINIKADALIAEGNGTSGTPYVIK